jgi:hypothetical protein
VSENRDLGEYTGGSRKLCNEELHKIYSLLDIGMDRASNTDMRNGKCIENFSVKTYRVETSLNTGVDGRMVLN